jgi:hypothetical protein
MAKTSRNPFAPPPVPMKRRKKLKEAAVLVPTAAVAVPAARTQKKKKTATTSAKQNLDLRQIHPMQRKTTMRRRNGSPTYLVGRHLVSMTFAILMMMRTTTMRTTMTEWMRKLSGLSIQTETMFVMVVIRLISFLVGPNHLSTMG